MIKKIRCDKSSFKEVEFTEGFNVVIAERDEKSTQKDSRNGTGKSTLIDIIHYCLGSTTLGSLEAEALADWTFILDIELGGKMYVVKRNTTVRTNLVEIEGDFANWPIKPEKTNEIRGFFLSINDWNKVLGYFCFSLSVDGEKEKYTPSFRSLISYFIRRGIGAFNEPFKYYPGQKEWNCQVNNTFLLGLDSSYVAELQVLKDKEKTLQTLRKAAREGLLTGFVNTQGELEAERVRVKEEYDSLSLQLQSYKVHPEYSRLQDESNKLTEEIHELTNSGILNRHILGTYNDTVSSEQDVTIEEVKDVYDEAGVVLPEGLLKSLDEVTAFHKQITENRKSYLESEIQRIQRTILESDDEIKKLSNRRAGIWAVLKTHGALEEYSGLQSMLAELRQKLEEIQNRIESYRKLQESQSEIRIQKEELLQKMRRDYDERVAVVDDILSLFNKNSTALYSEAGIFSIDITDSGYKFNVEIKRAGSEGVGHMKIFCYDLTLAQVVSKKFTNISLPLIHDSAIFDGVDERQIAKALELAYAEAETNNFQYVCMLNSDTVPRSDFSEGFEAKFDTSIRSTFTDSSEDGGLLGIRF